MQWVCDADRNQVLRCGARYGGQVVTSIQEMADVLLEVDRPQPAFDQLTLLLTMSGNIS